jgi:hypothetical protein
MNKFDKIKQANASSNIATIMERLNGNLNSLKGTYIFYIYLPLVPKQLIEDFVKVEAKLGLIRDTFNPPVLLFTSYTDAISYIQREYTIIDKTEEQILIELDEHECTVFHGTKNDTLKNFEYVFSIFKQMLI